MDLLKKLIELNNRIELKKISDEKFTLDDEEIDEEIDEEYIKFIEELKINFMNDYLKKNNRQFKLKKYFFVE